MSQEDAKFLLAVLAFAGAAWSHWRSRKWLEVRGRVVARGRAELLRPARSGRYDVVLNPGPRYFVQYRVRGKPYEIRVDGEDSVRIGPWVVWRSRSLPKRVIVLVDPEDPSDAILRSERDMTPALLAVFGLLLLAWFLGAQLEWYWDGPIYRARWPGTW